MQFIAWSPAAFFATLIRLLGDFDLAEDAVHDAFAAALERWPQDGVPANPRAWLISTGRFKAIDALRRRARFNSSQEKIVERLDAEASNAVVGTDQSIEDDQLRLRAPSRFGKCLIRRTLKPGKGKFNRSHFYYQEYIMKYICLGYIEPNKFENLSESERNAMADE